MRRGHSRGRRHPRRRLFWRVYLHSIFLLVAVVAATVVLGFLLGRGDGQFRHVLAFKRQLESGGPELLADRPALTRLLGQAGERANVDATLYDVRGQLLATNVEPLVPPLGEEGVASMGEEPKWLGKPHGVIVIPIWMRGQLAAYAVADWNGPGIRELTRGTSYLVGVLVALALASAPLVRTLISPLERLTQAVHALGAGDLSVRSGIRRRDEVGELASAFDEMAARLERLVRNERELLANVSHELRTPLSRIRVALELAAEGDSIRAKRYLQEIGSDLAELDRLVEDVLTAARLDARWQPGESFPLHPRSVRAEELCEAAARRFREAWPERPLLTEVPGTLPVLEADPVLLRRVLDNLLDNARKYSDDGKPVTLRASTDGDTLQVEVRDEGIGMTGEDLRQLFTPFFRSDRSRARGTGGVGLGLTLARRIVEAHQGTLTAESTPGVGTTFTVRLPRLRVASSGRPPEDPCRPDGEFSGHGRG